MSPPSLFDVVVFLVHTYILCLFFVQLANIVAELRLSDFFLITSRTSCKIFQRFGLPL